MTTRETRAALLDLHGIAKVLPELAELVRWCDGAGLERKVTGSSGGRSAERVDNGSVLCGCATPAERQMREARGLEVHDCAACRARASHRSALADVAAARASLNRARRSLERTLRAVGGSGGVAGTDEDFPRMVNNTEMREARAAAARRRVRGEDVPAA